MIRPIHTYGLLVSWILIDTNVLHSILHKVQRLVSLGFMRSTPRASLGIILKTVLSEPIIIRTMYHPNLLSSEPIIIRASYHPNQRSPELIINRTYASFQYTGTSYHPNLYIDSIHPTKHSIPGRDRATFAYDKATLRNGA